MTSQKKNIDRDTVFKSVLNNARSIIDWEKYKIYTGKNKQVILFQLVGYNNQDLVQVRLLKYFLKYLPQHLSGSHNIDQIFTVNFKE